MEMKGTYEVGTLSVSLAFMSLQMILVSYTRSFTMQTGLVSQKGPRISGRERAAELICYVEKHDPRSLDYSWSSFEDSDVGHELATRKWPDDHLDKVRIFHGMSWW
jgi:hypothetical protein